MPVDFTDFDRIKTTDRPPLGAGAVGGSPADNSGNATSNVDFSQVSGAPDLQAIEALTGTGIAVRTAADTWALRTLTAPAAGLAITNPAGVAGNPTFALANDLSAIEALSGTGYAKRTGTDAWALSSTVPWSDVSSTPTTLAGYGIVDAQPLDGDLSAIAALTGTNTIYYRSGASTWTAVTIGSGLSFTGGTLDASGGGGGSPGGSTTQVQFNNGGTFGGAADFTWSGASGGLIVSGNSLAGNNPTLKVTDSNVNEPVWLRIEQSNLAAAFELGVAGAAAQFMADAHAGDGIFKGFGLGTSGFCFGGGTGGGSPFTSLYIKYVNGGAKGRVIVGGVTDDGTNDLQVLDNAFVKNSLKVGNGAGAGPFIQLNSSTYTLLQYARGGVSKFSTGTAFNNNDFIAGTVQDDLAFKSDSSRAILFSTDNGGGFALRLGAGTGGAVEFGQLTLTTGLSIAIATKTFPLTINGTVVNVLCQ